MRRNLVVVAVLTIFSLFIDTAGAACRPIPSKKWTGRIRFVGHTGEVTTNYFTANECSWNGHEADFNGFDAVVFEVSKYAGLAGSFRWSPKGIGSSVNSGAVEFLDKRCQPVLNASWSNIKANSTQSFKFPRSAKWAIANASTTFGATDVDVTISSPGKKCPKKKRRRR